MAIGLQRENEAGKKYVIIFAASKYLVLGIV